MKRGWWLIALFVALLLAVASPLASSYPDGLERVAEDHGFIDRAAEPFYHIIPDYVFPGIPDEALATIVAGVVGTLLLFALGYGLASWLKTQNKSAGILQ
jgi:ABC-type spermidine/putrescine transport system permease subunit I